MLQKKVKLLSIVFISTIFLLLGGCANLQTTPNSPNNPPQQKDFEQYSESFVKVEFHLESSTKKNIPLWVGSAAYVSKIKLKKKSKNILTAAHVCKLSNSAKLALLINHGIDSSQYKKTVKIKLENFNTTAKVLKIDRKNDICFMKAKKENVALHLSNKAPKYGNKYYNIAAPSGVYGREMNLIYEGFYSGEKMLMKAKRDFYSIPVTGGSSGSPIIDRYGKIVGVVSMGLNNFEEVSISPKYSELDSFLYDS